jgi:hypothetical protein
MITSSQKHHRRRHAGTIPQGCHPPKAFVTRPATEPRARTFKNGMSRKHRCLNTAFDESYSSKSTAPLRFASARRKMSSSEKEEAELRTKGASASFSAAIRAREESSRLELESAWRSNTSRMCDSSKIFCAAEMARRNAGAGARRPGVCDTVLTLFFRECDEGCEEENIGSEGEQEAEIEICALQP